MLVESTTVDVLVDKLKTTSYRKSEEIKQKSMSQVKFFPTFSNRLVVAESVNVDDDIVAGPSKMSLKCPVSFVLSLMYLHITS